MRKLATVRRISKLEPIENADRIEKATIDGWECVVKKGEFKEGDTCIYFEIDSILPDHKVFEFMRERKFKVKTAKFRKQISQGLVMPTDILKEFANPKHNINIGDDVTDLIGVKKHDPFAIREQQMRINKKKNNIVDKYMLQFTWYRSMRYKLFGKGKFNFPDFIPKTDEERIQNIPHVLKQRNGRTAYIMEKIDGMSASYAVKRDGIFNRKKFYVCSRNLWLWKPDKREWWQIANNFDIKNKLAYYNYRYAIQGEIIGPRCNKNRLQLKEIDFYVFNVYDMHNKRRVNYPENKYITETIGLKFVPVLFSHFEFDNTTVQDCVDIATGNSEIKHNLKREGAVFRLVEDDHQSFKAINPEYLLKYGE